MPEGAALLCQQHEHDESKLPTQQRVFFLRHAESRWNRAQDSYALISMLWENDHGLSEDGRRQAEALRRHIREVVELGKCPPEEKPWVEAFTKPDVVYTSPFTRAVQTAAIGLRDLLPACRRLVVMPEARERKNGPGSVDSTGLATGEAIRDRVAGELWDLYAEDGPMGQEAAVQDFKSIDLDASAAEDEWWGGFAGDSEEEHQERLRAFVEKLRHVRGSDSGGGGVSVVIGHSHFFKAVLNACIHEEKVETKDCVCEHIADGCSNTSTDLSAGPLYNPSVNELLRSQLMPYCGIVGLRFVWGQDGEGRIVEAMPILGTQLAVPRAAGCTCGRATGGSTCVVS